MMSLTKLMQLAVCIVCIANLPAAIFAHEVTTNNYLEDCPGNDLVQGIPATNDVTMYYTTVRVTGPTINGTNIADYYALAYAVDNEDTTPFGPTLRVKRGETLTIKLVNKLDRDTFYDNSTNLGVAEQIAAATDGHGFSHQASINIHTHGIFGSPGLMAQPTQEKAAQLNQSNGEVVLGPADYTGGDNIFIRVPPAMNDTEEDPYVTYTNPIAIDHMPGMHWIHGHYEGMVATSVSSAQAIFIVEDDESFLPASGNCSNVWQYLDTVPETVMTITTTLFSVPPGAEDLDPPYNTMSVNELLAVSANNTDVLNAFLDFPNQQFMDLAGNPSTRICCNQSDTLYPFDANQTDYALINGAYMPRLRLPSNGWRRWRILNSSIQDMFEIAIMNINNTNKAEVDCEFQLYAKDGVYMMQIPRKVPALYVNPAARSEVFVRCKAKPGATFALTSGYGPAYDGQAGCDKGQPNCNYFKSILATIEIVEADETSNLPQLADNECTPLRPDYAADMRDPALKASKADKKIVKQAFSMTDLEAFGCNINEKWFEFPAPNPFAMTLGTIQELAVQYANHHAFHIHVQPFQLVNLKNTKLEKNSFWTAYFQEGDFHDTIYMPMVAQEQNVTVRLNPGGARFTGYSAAHCHLLPHEDEGCMVVTKFSCPGYENENEQPTECNVTSAIKGTYVAVPPAPTPAPGPSVVPTPAPTPGGPSPGVSPAPSPATPSAASELTTAVVSFAAVVLALVVV